ncbi:MAG: glycosyl hydrolase-related protein [Firmicutes bacterium]|nr:glycosyl hydrolase-related protein [Bacillota bacterium]
MINRKQNDRLIDKIVKLEVVYKEYLVAERETVVFEIAELGKSYPLDFETKYVPPDAKTYRPIKIGDKWGGEFCYAWFGASIAQPSSFKGKRVYLESHCGALESLVYVNAVPFGMFDDHDNNPQRLHKYLPLEFSNDMVRVDVEAYASHTIAGTHPYEKPFTNGSHQNMGSERKYGGFYLVVFNKSVERFLDNLKLLNSLYGALAENDFYKAELIACYEKIFILVDLMPSEGVSNLDLDAASKIIEGYLSVAGNKGKDYRVGIIGHSHLDTAWLWPVEETKRKAARTAATAVRLLKKYDKYKFIMSSVVHLDWIKNSYPALFEDIKRLVAQGRFEPNGAAWVEYDCNLTGGEAMIRQFVMGQKFLEREFGYRADCFWLPDTFGYSAALPQIMQKCGVKYFFTTKLSWNDTNKFPYDAFVWEGIDGNKVTACFNTIHCYAEPRTIVEKANAIQSKHTQDRTLIAYGFGDGGGGPDAKMVEYAIRCEDMPHIPKTRHTTISEYMRGFDDSKLPIYAGDLYLELHRGTFTAIHDIKRTNRKLEIALHDLEYVCSATGSFAYKAKIDNLYKILLLNQFHDILPGTCITEVNNVAVAENNQALEEARVLTIELLTNNIAEKNLITLINTLSFNRKGSFEIEGAYDFQGVPCYRYTDIDGNIKTVVKTNILAFGCVALRTDNKEQANKNSRFKFKRAKHSRLSTPCLSVKFDENMRIISMVDKVADRELASGVLNDLVLYRDVPLLWDNWDIDADYKFKGKSCRIQTIEEVVNNEYEFRLRCFYEVGKSSKLTQDIVFRADTTAVDFVSKLEWSDRHYLLKAEFDTTVFARTCRVETQFGHIEKNVLDNTSEQQAMFEVCNHKWTDLSEPNYGATLINDCKYGISVKRGKMGLTLIKGGAKPDYSADAGIKYFNYCFAPHSGGFSFDSVIKKAYEYNIPPIVINGNINLKPIVISSNPAVIIETVKPAEDGDCVVLRLYECEGNYAKTTLSFDRDYVIKECNLLEENMGKKIKGKDYNLKLKPFEIVTIKLEQF